MVKCDTLLPPYAHTAATVSPLSYQYPATIVPPCHHLVTVIIDTMPPPSFHTVPTIAGGIMGWE
ncbi:hypothetical protein VEE26_45070 (plasmid) [Escherichia coli]|nr:hypothetical protein VEE26_45070 [Escherichia coli]